MVKGILFRVGIVMGCTRNKKLNTRTFNKLFFIFIKTIPNIYVVLFYSNPIF